MPDTTETRSDAQKADGETAAPIFASDDNGMRGATDSEPYPTFDNEES